MAIATILHVGKDLCRRIPVMESAGMIICRIEDSIDGVPVALSEERKFSAIAFQGTFHPAVVSMARSISRIPMVLFEDPSVDLDMDAFDLIIPAYTPTLVWLRSLHSAIEKVQSF